MHETNVWEILMWMSPLLIIPGLFALVAIHSFITWMRFKNKEIPKRSEPSDNAVEEMKNILLIVTLRDDMTNWSSLSQEERKSLEELNCSSEFLSLVRYAHFAGYNLTYEQDDEDNEPADFKTDVRRAAVERRKIERKRYYD